MLTNKMVAVAPWLDKRKLLGYSTLLLVRVQPEPMINFDWYATPKQTYHTYPEVRGWFEALGWPVVADQSQRLSNGAGRFRRAWNGVFEPDPMVTVKA